MAEVSQKSVTLSPEEQRQLEALLLDFDYQWTPQRLAAVAAAVPFPEPPARLRALVELVKIDLERHWRLGNRTPIESYLQRFTELAPNREALGALVVAEYQVRRQSGASADVSDFARRFPELADDLPRLLEAAHAIDSHLASPGRATLVPNVETPSLGKIGEVRPRMPERFGRYRILRLIGEGGMGSVYLAEDAQLDRQVALKVPHFSASDGPETLERFHREARLAAKLVHPNICRLYDVGEIEAVHYLTMDFVEGKPVSAIIKGDKPPQPRQAALIVRKLARALHEAHQQGIIHRDLKPANVMINRRGEPIVMDFGLARSTRPQDPRLTDTGMMLGTPAYMSPEQVTADTAEVGPRTDIYSLGVMLYEMLAGELPYLGTVGVILGQILHAEPPPISRFRPDVDPRLESICLKAMAKRPADRFASMAEFAEALSEYLRGQSTQTARAADDRVAPIPAGAPLTSPIPAGSGQGAAGSPAPKSRQEAGSTEAEEFDPYHRWLGIPKDQRPPTQYQLLGIAPGEQDRTVIDEAVIRQSTYLRTYQRGPHAVRCARLLEEVAEAGRVLLDLAERAAYDASLGERLRADTTSSPPGAEPAADFFAELARQPRKTTPKPQPTPVPWLERLKRNPTFLWLTAAAATIVVALSGVIYITTDKGRLEVRFNEYDVHVAVLKDGKELHILDPQTGSELRLKSGIYELALRGGENVVELSKDRVILRRGGTEIVEVRPAPAAVARAAQPTSKEPVKSPAVDAQETLRRVSAGLVWLQAENDARRGIGVVTDIGVCTVYPGTFQTIEIATPDGRQRVKGAVGTRTPFPFCWVDSAELNATCMKLAAPGSHRQAQKALLVVAQDGKLTAEPVTVTVAGTIEPAAPILPNSQGVVAPGPVFNEAGECLGYAVRLSRDQPIQIYPLERSGSPPTADPANGDFYARGPVGVPQPLEFNTGFAESAPSLSGDGLELYFAGDRKEGSGGWDLFVARRKSIAEPFKDVVGLRAASSPAIERVPAVAPDGLSLYFQSDRTGGKGLGDIYVARRASKAVEFGTATPLAETATDIIESRPIVSANQRVLCFVREPAPPGPTPEFLVGMRRTTEEAFWIEPTNLPGHATPVAVGNNGSLLLTLTDSGNRMAGTATVCATWTPRTAREFIKPIPLFTIGNGAWSSEATLSADCRLLFYHSNQDLYVVRLPDDVREKAYRVLHWKQGDAPPLVVDFYAQGPVGEWQTMKDAAGQPIIGGSPCMSFDGMELAYAGNAGEKNLGWNDLLLLRRSDITKPFGAGPLHQLAASSPEHDLPVAMSNDGQTVYLSRSPNTTQITGWVTQREAKDQPFVKATRVPGIPVGGAFSFKFSPNGRMACYVPPNGTRLIQAFRPAPDVPFGAGEPTNLPDWHAPIAMGIAPIAVADSGNLVFAWLVDNDTWLAIARTKGGANGYEAPERLFNLQSRARIPRGGKQGCAGRFALSPDASYVMTSLGREIQVLRLPDEVRTKIIATLGLATPRLPLAKSPLVEPTIIVDPTDETLLFKGHIGEISVLGFSPDGKLALSASFGELPFPSKWGWLRGTDQTIRLWDLELKRQVLRIQSPDGSIRCAAFSPDGRYIASGNGYNSRIRVWDSQSGRLVHTMVSKKIPERASMWTVAWSPDGKRLIAGGREKVLAVWDATSGAELQSIELPEAIGRTQYASDGKEVANWDGKNAIVILNLGNGKETQRLNGRMPCACVRSGKMAFLPPRDSRLQMWDIREGRLAAGFKSPSVRVNRLAMTPDGRRVVTANDDATLCIWDGVTGNEIDRLGPRERNVNLVAIAPNGSDVLFRDGTVDFRLWRSTTE